MAERRLQRLWLHGTCCGGVCTMRPTATQTTVATSPQAARGSPLWRSASGASNLTSGTANSRCGQCVDYHECFVAVLTVLGCSTSAGKCCTPPRYR